LLPYDKIAAANEVLVKTQPKQWVNNKGEFSLVKLLNVDQQYRV
jgi:hypothetical protein